MVNFKKRGNWFKFGMRFVKNIRVHSLLLAAYPFLVQAQFNFVTNNGAITITGYTGFGGALTIPSTINNLPVTSIGDGAFSNAFTLRSVVVPDSVTSIGNNAFSSCGGLTSVTLGTGVTNIGAMAFTDCENLPGVTIPNRVVNLDDNAFSFCYGLTNVTLGTSITRIGAMAFGYCINLSGIMIPNSVTAIESNAFYDCRSLTNLTIGTSVTNLGNSAFAFCASLTTVTVPESVTAISDSEFLGCSSLTNIILPGGITNIGETAFSLCFGLFAIALPDSVRYIGDGTFSGCSNLADIQIGTNVTSIGEATFANCPSLTSISIPGSVTNLGPNAFIYCSGLTNIIVDLLNSNYSSEAGILFNKDQTALIEFPAGFAGIYTIASNVTNVQDNAFFGCSGLTGVDIPPSVIGIGYQVFTLCSSLTNITVDSHNPAYSSLAGVLFDKQQTTLIQFPNVTSGAYSIPDTVTGIDDNAAYSCAGLTDVNVPPSVTNIGVEVFAACANLTNITVDPGNEFYSSKQGVLFDKNQTTLIQCPAGIIGSYLVPSSVTGIGAWSFEGCADFTNVVIPASVASIGSYTFYNCTNLTGAYFEGNAPIDDSTEFFGENFVSTTVYYLPGTTGWGSWFGDLMTTQWYLPNPRILNNGSGLGVTANQFGFTISWATNASVIVEASTNLTAGAWTPLQTNELTSGTAYFSDPQWTNYKGRFYRLRSP